MRSQKTDCIILGHKNIGEKDKFVFVYSKEFGKLKLTAKGARSITSKFVGHLETLNICEISFYIGPHQTILQEILTHKNFLKNSPSLEVLRSAIEIAKITNNMLYENHPTEELFELLKTTIKNLKKAKNPELIYLTYSIKFLDKLGLIPDFKTLKTATPSKYLKFFNFVKEKTFEESLKISLSNTETEEIKRLIKEFGE